MTSTIQTPPPPSGPPPTDGWWENEPTPQPNTAPPEPAKFDPGSVSIPVQFDRAILAIAGPFVLALLALFGFGATYGGTSYFVAGATGLLLGTAIAWWSAHKRQPAIVLVAVTIVVFFVAGGPLAVRRQTIAGFIPTPASFMALVDGAIEGWARLLTITRPAGDTANLLTIPYMSGMVCGVLTVTIAMRTRRPRFAVIPPVVLLILSILFGEKSPSSLVLQGAVFGGVMLGWLSHMTRQKRRIEVASRRSKIPIGSPAVLLIVSLLAFFANDLQLIPGAGSRERVVLTSTPPFDPTEYPSPLMSFRRFTNGTQVSDDDVEPSPSGAAETDSPSQGWRSTPLFEVDGLPQSERLRLATLDTYDGVVYTMGNGQGSSGYFQRVGGRLTSPVKGEQTVTVKVLGTDADGYRDIWLPTVTGLKGLSFSTASDKGRLLELSDSLQVNLRTKSAAIPGRLQPGDTYQMKMVPSPQLSDKELGNLKKSAEQTSEPLQIEAIVKNAERFASEQICAGSTDRKATYTPLSDDGISRLSFFGRAQLIADNLRVCGGFSDGRSGTPSPSGHGQKRLTDMIAENQREMIGNSEQYAPLAALFAQANGIPARVVMGFRSKAESDQWFAAKNAKILGDADTYVVRGADVVAWIEVALGEDWVPVSDVTPIDESPEVVPEPQPQQAESDPPPPPPSIPPSDEGEADANKVTKNKVTKKPDGFSIPGWVFKAAGAVATPIALLSLFTGIIAGLKAWRRKKRRTDGTMDARIDGGWGEIKDLALDMGSPVPELITRREAAMLLAKDEASKLAHHADLAVFGPTDLSDQLVDRYWNEVDATRGAMVADLSKFGRWKVLVSLASLRASGLRIKAKSAVSKATTTASAATGALKVRRPRRPANS